MSATNNLTNALLLAISERWPGSVVQRVNVIAGVMASGRFVRSMAPGTSDIIGVLGGSGKFLAIEVKTGRDRATAKQLSYLAAVIRAGGIGIVAHDVSGALRDLETQLERRGAPA